MSFSGPPVQARYEAKTSNYLGCHQESISCLSYSAQETFNVVISSHDPFISDLPCAKSGPHEALMNTVFKTSVAPYHCISSMDDSQRDPESLEIFTYEGPKVFRGPAYPLNNHKYLIEAVVAQSCGIPILHQLRQD